MAKGGSNDIKGLISLSIIAFVVFVSVISAIGSSIISLKVPLGILFIVSLILFLAFQIYSYFYFKSQKFRDIKSSIKDFINNCNELNHHIQELKGSYVSIKSYDYGVGHLKDESNYSFKRQEWDKSIKNNFVHNCSLTVCRNASDQPFKYLCKYFNIDKTEDSLSEFESVLNDFAAAEQGKFLLQKERDSILNNIKSSIPWVINFFNKKNLIRKLGFEEIDLSDLYFPSYTFQYVSGGGNSSMRFDIKLDVDNLDSLISYLQDLIKFRKSIAGQRALMTSGLREKIKSRDNYTCQICTLSTSNEPNLLLEIDHITPLSKGGITSENNLQTLCWRCNRTKGSKIF